MFGPALRRVLRRVHGVREHVPGELRGWRWDEPPVKPRAYLGLGVSEVAYRYCESFRDVWLRRVKRASGSVGEPLRVGLVVHQVFHEAAWDLRRLLGMGLEPWDAAERLLARAGRGRGWPRWAVGLYKALITMWAGESAGSSLLYGGVSAGWLPWLSEYLVDGSPLGLSSRLRVDAVEGAGIVVEVKYGQADWRHYVGLAGYALALEAAFEAPYDYGVVVRVTGVPDSKPRITLEPVYIGEELRRRFLENRDDAIDVILSRIDPGVPSSCNTSCPFYSVCHPGVREG